MPIPLRSLVRPLSLALCLAGPAAAQLRTPLPVPGEQGRSSMALDWTVTSPTSGDFGVSVCSAGDVNGDGYDDVLYGAQGDSRMVPSGGSAALHLGSASGLSAAPSWEVFGDAPGAYFGNQVAPAGDVDGDGYDDVLVSSLFYSLAGFPNAGRVWLFRGSPSGLEATASWWADGEQATALFGSAVSAAGDVNGDGYDDVVVGSFGFDLDPMVNHQEGRAYVYLGSASGLGASAAWTFTGLDFAVSWGVGSVGQEVSDAGDVDADGYDDLLIAADYSIALFLGGPGGPETSPSWTNNQLFQIGQDVAGIGDVNGDGYDDIAASTLNYDFPVNDAGAVVVFLGGPGGPETSYSWLAHGEASDMFYGWSIGPAGDVNGDGFADLAVGSLFHSEPEPFEGELHVFHGSPQGLATTPSFAYQPNVPGTRFGISAETAGDCDGDGYADVVVGANTWPNGGSSYGRVTVFRGGADVVRPFQRRAAAPVTRP